MSAAPSATWQNLIADPLAVRVDWSKRGQKSIGRRIEMRATYGGDRAFAWPGPRADRLSLIGAILQQPKPLGLHADNAAPNSAARGRGDDAGDWHAAGNDGEIDGKLITAGQELAGAIKRVHDQETSINTMALRVGKFLGKNGNARQ